MSEADLCRTLRDTLAAARHAVAAGSFIDLAGFDGVVAGLHDAVARLPASERPDIAAELGALLRDLDVLAAALTAQAGLESDAGGRRAVHAYTPPGKPE